MITLEGDSLIFRFPEVHDHASTAIEFQRTLRIPDDGKHYPLPPGLGAFPLRHLEDFAQRVPENWRERGGVTMPLYQAEAMWIPVSTPPSFARLSLRHQNRGGQNQRHQWQAVEARAR